MNRVITHFLLFAALPLLFACGAGPKAKIGSTDTKGKPRLAVLDAVRTDVPDQVAVNTYPVQISGPVNNSDWLGPGYNSFHLAPNVEFAAEPRLIWERNVGEGSNDEGRLLASPIVVRDHVVTLDSVGKVTAFVSSNGKVLWERDTTSEKNEDAIMGGGLAASGDTVFVTTGAGEVLALDLNDGKILWRRGLQNPFRAAPTLGGDRVFVTSLDNLITALNAKNGQVLWQYRSMAESATLMGAASPAVVGNMVVVPTTSGDVVNLRSENGRVNWAFSLASSTNSNALLGIADIRALPVVDRDRVIAISHGNHMAAIDLRTGDRIWETDIGGVHTPMVQDDVIFVLLQNHRLVALTRDRGQIIWSEPLPEFVDKDDPKSDTIIWSGPVLAGGRLWLVNSQGHLQSFDPADGKSITQVKLDAPIFVPPVVAGRTMYVVTDNGTLLALK
jgi:outer membrane protein assembly factor BamB